MTIGIIHNRPIPKGEPNWESSLDVMVQVEAIATALRELGHEPATIPFDRDLATFVARLRQAEVEVVFNLCESVDDDPLLMGHPAAVLELLGLPFTGSSAMALTVSTDKVLVKRAMQAAGLPTPGFFLYEGGPVALPPQLTFPLLMKPRWQDASIGIDQDSLLRAPAGMEPALAAHYASFGPLVVEEYLAGREFNVALLGYPEPRVMPLAEIDFSGFPTDLFRIVGYRAKWEEDSPEYRATNRVFPDLPPPLAAELRRVAAECFHLFDLRDYGRVDLRLDGQGRVQVLEINANPCLSPDAGFPAAVAANGLDYTAMVAELLALVTKRKDK
jgi:D-alanine-D-alanine ligase